MFLNFPCAGVPRLISDEDDRSPQKGEAAKDEDLLQMMRDEDARRRCLFNESIKMVPTAKVNKRRRAPPGAHIGFELARAATQKTICCGACGEIILS